MRLIKSYAIPVLFFLSNFLLRLSLISKGPYQLDCLTMARQARQTVLTGHLHYLHSHGFPFSAMLAALAVSVGQRFSLSDPVLAVNLMSVVFSSLCLPLFYLTGRKLAGHLPAAVATGMFAVTPIFFSLSEFGNTHLPSLFFSLAGLLFLLYDRDDPHPLRFVGAAVCLGLAGAARVQDLAVQLPAACLLYLLPGTRKRPGAFRRLAGLLAAVLIIITVFYLPILLRPHATAGITSWKAFFTNEILIRLSGLSFNYALLSLSYLLDNFSTLGILLILTGHAVLFRQNRPLFFVLLAWYAGPLCLFSLLDIVLPRYYVAAGLPLCLFAGAALATLLKQKWYFKISGILVLVIWSWMTLYRFYPMIRYRHDHALLPDYVRWIARHTRPRDYLICGDLGTFLSYYGGPRRLPRPLKVRQPYTREELERFRQDIDRALASGANVYISDIGLFSHDPHQQFSKFMGRYYTFLYMGHTLYEDWHRGAIYQYVYPLGVYKVIKR